MKNSHAKAKGFTLVETLVAIAVLMMVIMIPYYSVERALIASEVARDGLTASSLAQEDIEFIRSVRDYNYIYNHDTSSSIDWMADLDGTVGPSGHVTSTGTGGNAANCFANTCAVDTAYQSIQQCADSTCSAYPVYIDTNGWYNQTAHGNKTSFNRTVQLSSLGPNMVKVVSTVSWTTAHQAYTTQVTDYLYNWLAQ